MIDFHDRVVRGIKTVRRVEIDETWSYVLEKPRNRSKGEKRPSRFGEVYTWIALCPDTKFLLSWKIGDRMQEVGQSLLEDLNQRVEGRVLISTDAYAAYPMLVERTMGHRADHVLVRKEIVPQWTRETGEKRADLIALWKEPVGHVPATLVSTATTSHVERFNATLRNNVSRMYRSTFKFSKKFENHCFAQAMFFAYYNFVRPHRGFQQNERKLTPAIKAGLITKLLSFEDLVDETDAYWRAKEANTNEKSAQKFADAKRALFALSAGQTSPLPFFVMYSPKRRQSKIHLGSCRSCRNGLGRLDGEGINQWFAFETAQAARDYARTIAPHDNSDCAMCMRKFNRQARRRL